MKKTLTGMFLAALSLMQPNTYAQTVLLQENFSSESLPSDWINDSLGNPAMYVWEFTNPGGRNIPGSNFDTSFVILDSDHYGTGAAQNASLTTDTFSALGYSGLTLELDEQYFTQSSPGSFRKIEASGDQGASWFTLAMDSVSVGYPAARHSFFGLDTLAGDSGVMIRFTFTGTWDYWWALDNLQVTAYTPCTAPPDAGQTLSSHAAVCSTTDFNLSLTGNTVGTGLTYQWQNSSDSLVWTDLPGATNASARISQNVSTYYRCMVTCSGLSDSSAAVFVEMNLPMLCYCLPQNPLCSNINFISGVSISGTTLDNVSSCQANDSGYAYVSYPASGNTTAIVHQLSTYDFSVSSTGTNNISLWIDYDHSGTFEADEWYRVSTNSVQGTPSVVSIQIPDSAAQGLTGMRIRTRAVGNTNGSGDACTAFLSGETEDYYLFIDTLLSGIQQLAFPGLVIYPNPVSSIVNIDFGKIRKENVTVTLLNMLGSTLRTLNVAVDNPATLTVSDIAEGLYLLKISDKTGFTVRKLVIKRN